VVQDATTGALLFMSSCNPFGANPDGEQVFALRPDGTGLRQLTRTLGASGIREPDDGIVHVELPGPYAYSTPRQDEGL
jgi:hypothetical protein